MLILNNSGELFQVVTINKLLLLYNNEISDQICIDFSAEKIQKLPVAAAKACCNALSAITEWVFLEEKATSKMDRNCLSGR